MRARADVAALGLATLGFVSLGLPEGLLGVAWPSMRASFDLPLDALGLLLATFASGYCVSSALSGRVLDRFGIGSVLAVSCGLTGCSLLGYALSPTWALMVALGGVLGLGAGTIDAALNTYAAVAHGPRVLNWMHAAFGLGAAVGPLVMTAILGAGLAWNVGYLLVAVMQLGLAAGYAVTRGRLQPRSRRERPVGPAADRPAAPMLGRPVVWLSLGIFFVYAGLETTAGQWSFSLFTQARDMPTTIAGLLVSAYWGGLTAGRLLFGMLVTRLSPDGLLRACTLLTVAATGLIWVNLPIVSWLAVGLLGLLLAPVFPVLIARTPARLGQAQTASAIGLQVAAAVLGGAGTPAVVGVVAARAGLEIIGPCLVAAGLVQLGLHEVLLRVRPASEPPRSAKSRSSAAASSRPDA